MSTNRRCPQCQSEILAGMPEGLCPRCLLKEGLATDAAEAEPRTTPFREAVAAFVPPAPAELQAAFPQFEMLELLGKGGMGAVYKARQPKLDRLVAVKILPPEISRDPAFAERFNREARALARLNHPSIVGIHDFGQANGYCYFAMEYVDGVNLRQAMQAGALKAAEALKIVPQICDALQFAHDEGVVHRDIKPENILLDRKGRVKIADFGLAKLLGQSAHDVSLTGTQQVMGTLHYMAPEQFEGSRDVDHRADIYSLGVTFYEMLTGELPIGRFVPPSQKVQVDVRLDEVVLRSLERKPEQRYQHASEIKSEMEQISRVPQVTSPAGPVAAGTMGTGIVRTIGGLNLLAAMPMLILATLELEKITLTDTALQLKLWFASSALHFLAGMGLFAGGIGMMMLERWGHRIVLFAALVELIHLPAEFAAIAIPDMDIGRTILESNHNGRIFFSLSAVPDWFFFLAQVIVLTRPGAWRLFPVKVKSEIVREPVQNIALTTVSSAWQKTARVLGGLNLFAAVPLLLLGAVQMDLIRRAQHSGNDVPDLEWWYLSSGLHCLTGVSLFVGGMGLLLLNRWGLRTVVGVSLIAVLHLAAQAVAVLTNQLQPIPTHMQPYELFWAAIIDGFFLVAQVIVLLQGNLWPTLHPGGQRLEARRLP